MKALITGITGMDGSYLAELLLQKGYEVHGIIRRSSSFNTKRIDHIFNDLQLYYGDLSDGMGLSNIIVKVWPDEIYNLAAMSHVKVSFDIPEYTTDVDCTGVVRLLEIVRHVDCKLYQASSSELFGSSPPPQNELTPFRPKSPYGVAKLAAYWNCVNYREGYNMFVSNGILFNHTGPRRGETFVSKKITKGVANIIKGNQKELYLGNLAAKRDWGYAPDYVEAQWMMLQHGIADDFVIATGEMHSVGEFVEEAFNYVGLDCREYVKTDARLFRPTEVDALCGNATKARAMLGWQPKTKFKDIIKLMVEADLHGT